MAFVKIKYLVRAATAMDNTSGARRPSLSLSSDPVVAAAASSRNGGVLADLMSRRPSSTAAPQRHFARGLQSYVYLSRGPRPSYVLRPDIYAPSRHCAPTPPRSSTTPPPPPSTVPPPSSTTPPPPPLSAVPPASPSGCFCSPSWWSFFSYGWWSGVFLKFKLFFFGVTATVAIVANDRRINLWVGEDLWKSLREQLQKESSKIIPPADPMHCRLGALLGDIIHEMRRDGIGNLSADDLHSEHLMWMVVVVENDNPYILGLVQGKVIVYTGMLKHLATEEELIFGMFRVVAHLTYRHAMIPNMLVWLALKFTKAMGLGDSFHLPIDKLLLKFKDSDEKTISLIGKKFLIDHGYDEVRVDSAIEKVEQMVDAYPSTKSLARQYLLEANIWSGPKDSGQSAAGMTKHAQAGSLKSGS